MFAIRNLLRANTQVAKKVVAQRNMSAIAVPSRQKVSRGETLFLASVLLVCWTAIPAWVLVNIKNYRHKE